MASRNVSGGNDAVAFFSLEFGNCTGGGGEQGRAVLVSAIFNPVVPCKTGLGMLEGSPDGSFEPKRQATRAQAVTVLHRLLDQMEK